MFITCPDVESLFQMADENARDDAILRTDDERITTDNIGRTLVGEEKLRDGCWLPVRSEHAGNGISDSDPER